MPLSDQQIAGRSQCLVTASEVPALMGEDPRRSYFQLWHEKAGLLPRDETESEAMAWGNALEAPIARTVAQQRGWKIRKVARHLILPWSEVSYEVYRAGERPVEDLLKAGFRDIAPLPLGASLDYEVARGSWVPMEVKAVGRFASRAWEGGQPPLPVLLQVQAQLACARAPLGIVAGLRSVTGPADVAIIPRHEPTIRLIFRAVLDLEISLARGEAPAPDLDRSGDIEAVLALHRVVTDGKILDRRGDPKVEKILGDYRSIAEVKGCAQKEQDRLWAELLQYLGADADFRELIANESKATRWTVAEKEVPAHTKKAFTSYGVYRRKA